MKKLFFILTIFFLDRITKIYFLNLQEIENDVYIPVFSFLNFIFTQNTGTAFGLWQFEPKTFAHHILTIVIISINLIIFLITFEKINNLLAPKKILNFLNIPNNWRKDLYSYMFALILGGALGNLYDRIINYAVVDFIDLHIHDIHWPAFNIGDSFITLGVIGIILCELIIKEKITKNDEKKI